MHARRRSLVLLSALVAILAACLLYPIALTVGGAFRADDGRFTLHHVLSVFEDPVTRRGLLNSAQIGRAHV